MSNYLKYINSEHGVRQIFTREKIAKMSSQEYKKNEKRIHKQYKEIGIPTNFELSKASWGKIFIWHIKDNRACSDCKEFDGNVYYNYKDIPDDLHCGCRCFIEKINLGYV